MASGAFGCAGASTHRTTVWFGMKEIVISWPPTNITRVESGPPKAARFHVRLFAPSGPFNGDTPSR
jgi:hypothetical protein